MAEAKAAVADVEDDTAAATGAAAPLEWEQPVEVRAAVLRHQAYETDGYIGDDGEFLEGKAEDTLYNAVIKAQVHKTSERKATTITRTNLTKMLVPSMAGPGEYQEAEDPEAAALAWTQVNSFVWRKMDTNASGPIQTRLNGETGLLLCRTTVTSEKGVEGVYVTDDWACIFADFISPDQKKIEAAIVKMAANGAMGATRFPEFAKKFRRELSTTTKTALDAGISKITLIIEAHKDDGGVAAADDEGDE